MQLSEIRKTIINVLTLVVAVGTEPLFTQVLHWLPPGVSTGIGLVLGAATAILHYFVPNDTTSVARAQKISARYVPKKKAAKGA